MNVISKLDWTAVRDHYDIRADVHRRLLSLHAEGESETFADLMLGISDGHGNYSASQHGLGYKILAENADAETRLHALATRFLGCKSGRDVPPLVKSADLQFLKIAVGSEASAMMRPDHCWVTNTRTIWATLVVEHGGNERRASEALALYKDGLASEMNYNVWRDLHDRMESPQTEIADIAAKIALAAAVPPGELKYLWVDAVADAMYTGRG